MANYMKQVAEMLGVELGEEFQVIDVNGFALEVNHMIVEDGLIIAMGGQKRPSLFNDLLRGVCKIKKLPWRPKIGESYYSLYNSEFKVYTVCWNDTVEDYANLKCGMVFRTYEEALKARPRIYQELTGKEWSDST